MFFKLSILFSILLIQINYIKSQKCKYGFVGRYCDVCGKQPSPNLKIVGGIEANPHSWPSIAFIKFQYKYETNIFGSSYPVTQTYSCGGSLIDRDTVLTAAHCFVKKVSQNIPVVPNKYFPTIASMYTVYLGLHDTKGVFDSNINISPGIKMSVKSFIIHPNFDSDTNLNDIAIIKLSREVTLNEYIQPACLPDPTKLNYPNTKTVSPVWAIGWGTLSYSGSPADRLQNVKLNLYDSSKCDRVYPEIEKNWNKQICAGEYNGGKDTCQGDSGGPLFTSEIINGIKKYVVVGITSYGDGCAYAQKPGIYTKVSSFLSWIENVSRK